MHVGKGSWCVELSSAQADYCSTRQQCSGEMHRWLLDHLLLRQKKEEKDSFDWLFSCPHIIKSAVSFQSRGLKEAKESDSIVAGVTESKCLSILE